MMLRMLFISRLFKRQISIINPKRKEANEVKKVKKPKIPDYDLEVNTYLHNNNKKLNNIVKKYNNDQK